MAEYTMYLRDVIEHFTQDQSAWANAVKRTQEAGGSRVFILPEDEPTPESRITAARDRVLAANVQWASDAFKNEFWNSFCETCYMRELEDESFALFKLHLNGYLRELLPKYNALWLSTQEQIDKYVDYQEIEERDLAENETGSAQGLQQTTETTENRNVFNDTPTSKLGDADYATTITDDSGKSGNLSNTQSNDSRDRGVVENVTRYGRRTPQAELLLKYRETLINVTFDLIAEIEPKIFLNIYD